MANSDPHKTTNMVAERCLHRPLQKGVPREVWVKPKGADPERRRNDRTRRFERIACVGLARASVPTLGTARGALAPRRRLKTDFNEPESRCDVCKKQRGCACVRVGDNHYRCIKKPDTMKKCENSHNRISDEFHTVWRCRGAESGSRRRPRPATHALRRFGREPSAETGGRGDAA